MAMKAHPIPSPWNGELLRIQLEMAELKKTGTMILRNVAEAEGLAAGPMYSVSADGNYLTWEVPDEPTPAPAVEHKAPNASPPKRKKK